MMKVIACAALLALVAVGCNKEEPKPAIDVKAAANTVQQAKDAAKDAAKDVQAPAKDAKAK